MTELRLVNNYSQITVTHFNPVDWLSRWTDAGGGYVAVDDDAHILRTPTDSDALDCLWQEISNAERREALADHLRGLEGRAGKDSSNPLRVSGGRITLLSCTPPRLLPRVGGAPK